MKKFLSTLFSTLQGGVRRGLLFLALLATTTLWAYDFHSGDLHYNITSSSAPYTVEVSAAVSSITTATIPETVTYNGTTYSVTRIGYSAFRDCSYLTSVTIPNSVTSIGESAFRDCSSLTSITIPNSVTSIGDWAFCDCSSLTSITIPESVTSIGDYAFRDCSSLTSITIPNSVTSIGEGAFYVCSSLTSITIPNSVTSIRYGAFGGCSSLTSVTIPNSVTSIGKYAFDSCSSLTSVTIPNSVTSIGKYAFVSCSSLTAITIPNSVTSIGDYAFSGCSSLSAPVYNAHCFAYMPTSYSGAYTIPEGIKQIAGAAFSSCSSLTSVTIPNSVTSIESSAFSGCSSLTSITIPKSVTEIGDYAFFSKSIKFIYCHRFTPPVIYDNTFSNYGALLFVPVHSFSYYDTNSKWGKFKKIYTGYGFEQDGLYYQAIDEEILSASFLSKEDFDNFTKLSIEGDQNWHYDSKYGAKMSGYSDASQTTYSNEDWLISPSMDLSKYSSATLKFSHAFGPATSVPTTVAQKAQYTCWVSNDFNDDVATATWTKLPIAYGTSAWSFITTAVDIPAENLKENCRIAWKYECTYSSATWEILSLNIAGFLQGKVQVISGFNEYSGDIVIPTTATKNDVTYDVVAIGSGAFKGCSSLTSITIPNSVTSIKDEAFWGCSSLNSVSISNSVTSIGYRAFRGCSSLTSITIPGSVTSIGDAAFGECSSLTSIIIPYGVTSIGKNTFWDCSSLSCVTIPNSVTNIGQWAFENCTSLNEITLPLSIKSIDEEAFAGCTKLYDIYCFAMEPPTAYESSFANYNAFLHVPCDNQRVYLLDVIFGNFKYIECIEAETTPTDTVIVTPSFNDAEFIWPSNSSADSYTLAISKDGEVFCTLTFNANGQLTGIAFAPSRNGQHHTPAAAQLANGFAFTVTGLDEGANYTYDLLIQDRSGNTLQSYSGEFRTQSTNDRTVTVEYDATQGQVTGAGTYLVGDTVTLTAIPNNGYRFVRWSNEVEDNPYTFVISDNVTLSAEFEAVIPSSLENTNSQSPMSNYQKIIRDGQLLILRDGKTYNVMGAEIQ